MKILFSTLLLLYHTASVFSQPSTVTEKYKFRSLYTVPFTPVKDQYLSSTCWSFSSMSLLESELLKTGRGETDLSEMFVARYSMLRKFERHLKLKGRNFFTPGGQFHDAVWVMNNYGLVPEEIYSGKGRGEMQHNHSAMDTALSRLVKKWLGENITALDAVRRKTVETILDKYYGPVPASFQYKGKTYTPQSFAKNYLGINPGDYIEITSYTHHPFYTSFVLEDKYNWSGDAYWNVPLADFMHIANAALDSGYSVGWDGDAEDEGFDFPTGLAALTRLPGANKQEARQKAFEDQSTLLNHMMHVVGRRQDEKGNNWYYIKNSWGAATNPMGGFIYMEEDYFALRTVAIIVNKKALPVSLLRRLQKAGMK